MASKLQDSKQRGRFLAVSAFFGKEESLKISALTFHFKKLQKWQQIKQKETEGGKLQSRNQWNRKQMYNRIL